jgi:ribosomal protein S18 acetylase RimI-like enzyme
MRTLVHKLFSLPGYHSELMQADDQVELQTLLERCADYSLLVTGSPPKPSAAVSLLTECPRGKTVNDKFVIGIFDKKQVLLGVLDAVRDYPSQADWWLGLLLLDPDQRNKGLGKRIYQAFEHWVNQQGARRIFLGVLEKNEKAYRFWMAMGFEVIEKQSKRQFGNTTHVVVVMARSLTER